MKKLNLILILALISLFSCQQEELNEFNTENLDQQSNANAKYNYAFAMKTNPEADISSRAFLQRSTKWDQNYTIDIVFLNGSTTVQEKVKDIAALWEKHINLRFEYIDLANVRDIEDVSIKISFYDENDPQFNQDKVSWSHLGVKTYDDFGPSMNIVLFDHNDSEELNSEEFQGQILKLFGLMLGLCYEHQGLSTTDINTPNINTTEVKRYYAAFGWDEDQIEKFLFHLSARNVEKGEFDPESIMMLYLPNYLFDYDYPTTEFINFEVQNNTLSNKDIEFINALYPKLMPSPWEKGEEGSVFMYISTADTWGNAVSIRNWDFDLNEYASYTASTYKTRKVGEYIWTAENMKIYYQNRMTILHEKLNFTQEQVNNLLESTAYSLEQFEDVFGMWATEYSAHYAYRDAFTFYDTRDGIIEEGWDLPSSEDIYQLLGQMPVKYADVLTNAKNFFYANEQVDNIESFGLINLQRWESLSGLAIPPLGESDNNDQIEVRPVYSFGYGFALKMKNRLQSFTVSDAERVVINNYNYHFTSARYCKPISDSELGYKIYVDQTNDKVIIQNINTAPASSWQQLPKGLERGIVLRYTNWDVAQANEVGTVTESWSYIQAEATKLRQQIRYVN